MDELKKIIRDENGLIQGVKYSFTEDGLVNWRKMINPKHLVVNKQNFERQGKSIPISIEGLNDGDLLVLLAGFKELASLRGFSSKGHTLTAPNDSCVISVCNIVWYPNFETENQSVSYASIGDATVTNAIGFGKMFLGPIAENRSFVRCVRNFLHVNILGQDELTPKVEATADTQQQSTGDILEDAMRELGVTFQTVKNTLVRDKEPGAEGFKSVSDIPKRLQFELLGKIKKKIEEKANASASV